MGTYHDASATLSLREKYTQTFDTNVAGTAVLTESLLPLLRASTQKPRVVFVSSTMGSLTTSLDKTTPFYAGKLPFTIPPKQP